MEQGLFQKGMDFSSRMSQGHKTGANVFTVGLLKLLALDIVEEKPLYCMIPRAAYFFGGSGNVQLHPYHRSV
jgi:hypothetical protein